MSIQFGKVTILCISLFLCQCSGLKIQHAYNSSAQGQRCSMEEVGVHMGVLTLQACQSQCNRSPFCAAFDGLRPAPQLYKGTDIVYCVLYSKVPEFVEEVAGDGSNQCHVKAKPTWLNTLRNCVQAQVANLSAEIDALPEEYWSFEAELKDEVLQRLEKYQSALDAVNASWEWAYALDFVEIQTSKYLYQPGKFVDFSRWYEDEPGKADATEEKLATMMEAITDLAFRARAHRLLGFVSEGMATAAHDAVVEDFVAITDLQTLVAELDDLKATLAAKNIEIERMRVALAAKGEDKGSCQSSTAPGKQLPPQPERESNGTTVKQEKTKGQASDSVGKPVEDEASDGGIHGYILNALTESLADHLAEQSAEEEALQDHFSRMYSNNTDMEWIMLKLAKILQDANSSSRRSRRSGPGDGSKRSSHQDKALGFVTLEVDKIVNPRKHTLTKMIQERCPSLEVQQPCNRKSYCQVQVRFSEQDQVECVIKAIAQNKGISGFRIREIDRVFESPRD